MHLDRILLASGLIIVTVVVLAFCSWIFSKLEVKLPQQVEVPWSNPKGIVLKPGPSSFWYNRENNLLLHRGPINDKLKEDLLKLVDRDDPSYKEAIGKLAFLSNQNEESPLLWLLLLGGVGGIIGVQIRSIEDFVGNACFKNELDVARWWPWYLMRPALGFLLGALIIILVKVDLLTTTSKAAEGSLWWLGLAVISGFGASDVIQRLRSLSQTLFGGK